MKTPLSLLLLSVVAARGFDDNSFLSFMPDPSWAKPISFNSEPQVSADEETCTKVYSCNGCKAAQVCKPTGDHGILALVSSIPCPKERPYCDDASGTCVKEAPSNCGEKDEGFICMGNGKYPDKDCTKFHVCRNFEATSFACSVPGHKYNPNTQTCEFTDDCGTFDCSAANAASKVAHSKHGQYFAYCDTSSNGLLVVDSCPPKFKLDQESQTCVPDCTIDGLIPDPSDCHFYYKCSEVTVNKGAKFMTNSRLQCPDKMAYSQSEFLCVAEETVANCKK